MKRLQRVFAPFFGLFLSLPYLLTAQNEGTYIDNLGVQDSSYMEQDLLAAPAEGSGSNTTVIIIVVVVIIIAAVAFFLLKKKKK